MQPRIWKTCQSFANRQIFASLQRNRCPTSEASKLKMKRIFLINKVTTLSRFITQRVFHVPEIYCCHDTCKFLYDIAKVTVAVENFPHTHTNSKQVRQLWILTDSEVIEKYKVSVIFLNAKFQQLQKSSFRTYLKLIGWTVYMRRNLLETADWSLFPRCFTTIERTCV